MEKDGKILARGKVDSTPEAIFEMLKKETLCPERIVLETGTLSNWLTEGLLKKKMPVSCVCARRANAVMKLNPNKTDDNDAQMLADMARTGFYREVAIKSPTARKRRCLLKARMQLVKQRRDIDNTMRGLLASFGFRLPKGAGKLPKRVRDVLAGRADLAAIFTPLLEAREACLAAFKKLDDQLMQAAKNSKTCQLLMTAPGVGPVTALTFVATIDDPHRFAGARAAGAYAGLTTRRYQSGEMDYTGRISKQGDKLLRAALYEAANVLLIPTALNINPLHRSDFPRQGWSARRRGTGTISRVIRCCREKAPGLLGGA
jgi:transposase